MPGRPTELELLSRDVPRPSADRPSPSEAASLRISVLVTSRTRREFLEEAVRSAADQTLAPDEYEIVVVKDFHDAEIDPKLARLGARLVTCESESIGTIMAAGLRACRGEVICFLDDDDVFEPTKLEAVRAEFARDPRLGYLHNGLTLFDEAGRPIGPADPKPGDRAFALSQDWGFCSSCISLRPEVLAPALDRWSEVPRSADSFLDYVSRVAPWSRRKVTRPLTRYRLHGQSNSARTNHARSYLATVRILLSLPRSRARDRAVSSLLGRYMSAALRGRSTDRGSALWALRHLVRPGFLAEIRPNGREVLCGSLLPLSPALARRAYSGLRKGQVDWLPPA